MPHTIAIKCREIITQSNPKSANYKHLNDLNSVTLLLRLAISFNSGAIY